MAGGAPLGLAGIDQTADLVAYSRCGLHLRGAARTTKLTTGSRSSEDDRRRVVVDGEQNGGFDGVAGAAGVSASLGIGSNGEVACPEEQR